MSGEAKCASCCHPVHAGRCPELEYVGHGYSPCLCGVVQLPGPPPSWEARLESKVDHLADAVLALHQDVRTWARDLGALERRVDALEHGEILLPSDNGRGDTSTPPPEG
jgi:hypothetical protein